MMKTIEVWYIEFRGDLTGNVCATVAAAARMMSVPQPWWISGTFR